MAATYAWWAACAAVTIAGLASTGGCAEDPIPLRMLTEDPVVMGISISVVEDGPLALDVAPLPADRPRAEVLPLDTVELDALVANVDGLVDLEDAAWVLCGGGDVGCLPSMERQGERYGALADCTESSATDSYACLAGRGPHPRVVMPALVPPESLFDPTGNGDAFALERVGLIVGTPEGPTTDACLEQLVSGPRVDFRGCAIGVRTLPFGPRWVMQGLLEEAYPWYDGALEIPSFLAELLPPNAAPQIEEVRVGVGRIQDLQIGVPDEQLETRSVHEVIEVEAGTEVLIEPVVPLRDQQLVLWPIGPESFIGRYESFGYSIWADAPLWGLYGANRWFEQFPLVVPETEGPVRVYVVTIDTQNGLSWFTLDLEVVPR